MLSKRTGVMVLVGVTLVVIIAAILAPRIAQPLSYHNFADRRAWLGIPNFGDVASNAGFAIAGIWGLVVLLGKPPRVQFVDSRERWPYVIVFAGMVLTAIGSAHYHLAPDNARLMWDGMPMTIVFMALVAAMIMERISVPIGLALLPILLLLGIASVVQWHISELNGASDLRFYAALQAYAVLLLLVILLLPPRYTRSSVRPAGHRGLLRFSEDHGNGGPPDFCVRPYCERPHHQASCRGRRGIVDFVDAAKTAAGGTPGICLKKPAENYAR